MLCDWLPHPETAHQAAFLKRVDLALRLVTADRPSCRCPFGTAAQFERARSRKRTKGGMRAAAVRRNHAGNPGLRRNAPVSIRKPSEARQAGHLSKL